MVLERNSIIIDQNQIEARFLVHLPGPGRKIDATTAIQIFERDLLKIVQQCFYFDAIDSATCIKFVECYLDQIELRTLIAKDGESLNQPREGGIITLLSFLLKYCIFLSFPFSRSCCIYS